MGGGGEWEGVGESGRGGGHKKGRGLKRRYLRDTVHVLCTIN